MNKTPIAVALERQIPEHIREEYALFVDFIKAYYSFLEQTQQRDLEDIRSIDRTLDEFVIRFKKELSVLFPTTGLEDERFILQRLREFYKSRGSKESYQFLFRAFFNRDAEIEYPSAQILRASDGKWQQDKSVFVTAYTGVELFNLAGKIIKIKTEKKHIDVYCPRVKFYRAGIYEVFIDRGYVSDITIDDIISFNDIDVGTIEPCPAKYVISKPGSGFEIGKLYNLPSESGDGSIIKITKIDSNGGIRKIQIISFGLDYKTSFIAKLSNTFYQPLEYFHPISSATIGAWNYNSETVRPPGFPSATFYRGGVDGQGNLINPSDPKVYGDTTSGYLEYGYINRNDYFLYQADYKGSNNILDIVESDPDNEANPYYADATYVGDIVASFYTNAANSVIIDESLAEIQIELGPVAIYPGYYASSDGFISDEIYIQDGKYYQLFSYVLKVEEQLDAYSELVKSLLHPAGFELFAQYNIKYEYLVSAIPLDAFVRYQYFDRAFSIDNINEKAIGKQISDGTNPISDLTPLFNVIGLPTGEFVTTSYVLNRELNDNSIPFDTNRNLTQSSIHLNKWDIAMGDVINPLINSIYTVNGNFENRVLGDTSTFGWIRDLTGEYGDLVTLPVNTGNITNREIVKGTSTEFPIENATVIVVHSPGLDWDFRGDTWKDNFVVNGNFEDRILGSTDTFGWIHDYGDLVVLPVNTGNITNREITKGTSTEFPIENAIASAIQSPGLDWDFRGDTWKDNFASIDDSIPRENVITKGTSTEFPIENAITNSVDGITRNEIIVIYDRSTIPIEQSFAQTFDINRNLTQSGIHLNKWDIVRGDATTPFVADQTNLTRDDLISFTWNKFKQPVMGLYTATLVAGSTEVILTGPNNTVVNTFVGLPITKVSGTGAFGVGAIVEVSFVTPNNKFTTNIPHATSGTITFTIASTDTSGATDLNADLNGFAIAINSSGLNWEFSGDTWKDNSAILDSIPRENVVVTYDSRLQNNISVIYDSTNAYVIGVPGSTAVFISANFSTLSNLLGGPVAQVGNQLSFTNNTDSNRVLVTGGFRSSNTTFYVPIRYIYVGAYSTTTITLPTNETIVAIGLIKVLASISSYTIDIIDPIDSGSLYFNPYNLEIDATGVSSYNEGGTYFDTDTRAIT